MRTYFFMNFASPPSLNTANVENSDYVTEGNARAVLSIARSVIMLRTLMCVAFLVLSSGDSTIILLLICFLLSKGVLRIVCLPVVLVPGMAQ